MKAKSKQKIFGLILCSSSQAKLIGKFCDHCDGMLFGLGLYDVELGSMPACKAETCEHEAGRFKLGESNSGAVWLRKLCAKTPTEEAISEYPV